MSYRLTLEAQADITGIQQYTLSHWGNEQSLKYLHGLHRTMKLLTETPLIGKQRPDITTNTMSFPYVSHTIYYFIDKQDIVIFAILHKSMVPTKHLESRDTH